MRRRLLSSAVVISLAVGLHGWAGASTSSRPDGRLQLQSTPLTPAVVARAMGSPATRWLVPFLRPTTPAAQRDIALALLGPRAASSDDFHSSFVSPLDDLDGDGEPELLTYDLHSGGAITAPSRDLQLTVLHSSTGTRLISQHIPDDDARVMVLAAPLGANGAPGLLLVTYHDATGRFSFQAFDGAGRRLWSSSPAAPAEQASLEFSWHGLLGHRGKASDLLLSYSTGTMAPVGISGVADHVGVGATQVVLVSGATGAMSSLGTPIADVDFDPHVAAGPDLNDDGREDVLIAVGAPRHGGTVRAMSSADGSTLWTSDSLDVPRMLDMPTLQGSAVGSTRPDVLVQTWEPVADNGPLTAVTGVVTESIACTVIDGASGHVALSRTAAGMGFCIPTTDVTRDGKSDLLIDHEYATSKAGVLQLEAVAPASRKSAWKVTETLHADMTHDYAMSGFLDWVGDLQGDGAIDWRYDFALATPADGKQAVERTIDGRTGRPLRLGAEFALLGSLDGHGDDLAQWSFRGRTVTLATVDGLSRRPLGTYRITLDNPQVGLQLYLTPTRGSCARHLMVVEYAVSSQEIAAVAVQPVDLRTGRPAWSVRPDGTRRAVLPTSRSGARLTACRR